MPKTYDKYFKMVIIQNRFSFQFNKSRFLYFKEVAMPKMYDKYFEVLRQSQNKKDYLLSCVVRGRALI